MATFSCLLLTALFIFYIYPPALHQFATLETVIDRLASLFLDVEKVSTVNPYAYVERTWINSGTYLMVSATNWITLALSFSMWFYQGGLMLRRHQPISTPAGMTYASYAVYSADGNRIAFVGYSDDTGGFPEIFMMNAGGSDVVRLVTRVFI
jgi:hypothetical protein